MSKQPLDNIRDSPSSSNLTWKLMKDKSKNCELQAQLQCCCNELCYAYRGEDFYPTSSSLLIGKAEKTVSKSGMDRMVQDLKAQ